MKTLLQVAKETIIKHGNRKFNDEELELVAAWLNGDIMFSQVQKAVGKGKKYTGGSQTYNFLAMGARELVLRGKYANTKK